MNQLQTYYQQRAKEYDRVYTKPERQADLKKIHTYLQQQAINKRILEIACGTGYWTQTMAKTCQSIDASDYSSSVLEIAQAKDYDNTPINFQHQDFWQLQTPKIKYDMVFGGFIWSHILKEKLSKFLHLLRQQIKGDGKLVFIDNRYVAGSNTPISRTDTKGNTYQTRKLMSGDEYEVLKNFPDKKEIQQLARELSLSIEWVDLQYY